MGIVDNRDESYLRYHVERTVRDMQLDDGWVEKYVVFYPLIIYMCHGCKVFKENYSFDIDFEGN